MRVFFDSSAFVKRYINESGTETVLAWCDRATEIVLSGIILPEIISAFRRLQRESRITEPQYRQLKSQLMADIEDAALVDLSPQVLAQAIVSLETNVLRGMDAIHIGAGVESGCLSVGRSTGKVCRMKTLQAALNFIEPDQ